jgi:uncharacterized damage-inducible protein DinB
MTASADVLVTPSFVRTMAAYNAEMNRRLYAAAGRLSADERIKDRGAFWKSIHGTLAHILWGDTMWMSRFDGWAKPAVGIKDSTGGPADFDALTAARIAADAKITDWALRVTPEWLAADLVWFSGAANREFRMAKSKLVTHFFNHQTHHRGQVHAMITAAGEQTGDTDLFLVV